MCKKKIAFATLGCKVNLYDTEAISELFSQKGYEITDFDKTADIYFINTCTVTNFSNKKSRQLIRQARKKNPSAIIAAGGCYAQTSADEVASIEGINIVVGTKNRGKIVEIIENYSKNNGVLNAVDEIMGERYFEPLKITDLKDRTRAFIKIQEGCDRFCSYCIIPYARGPVRSRQPNEILSEVERLSQNGFKEIVLTGIHIASYGKDLKNIDLIKIIKLIHGIGGINRIRLSSVEPLIVTDEFIKEIQSLDKLCEHFHLSLQSGCDKILKKMNRRYNTQQYEQAVKKLRSVFPDAAFTTDIITGFPGESEDDFKQSLSFAKKIGFAKIHSFPYSPKKGTPAASFPYQIPNEIKSERSRRMIELSDRLNKEFLKSFEGREAEVLFERQIQDGIFEGHTSNYIKVRAESKSKNIINKTLKVKIGNITDKETVNAKIAGNLF